MLSIIKNRRILSLVGVGVLVFSFLFASTGPTQTVYAEPTCPTGQHLSDDKTKCLDSNNNNSGVAPTDDGVTPADGDDNGDGDDGDEKTTTCAVESIGWILCPIINSAAKISDKAFDILANNFLATDAALINDKFSNGTETGTKQAWNIFKNLANVMFILAFLLVVVSQVTGYGISNYGLKKMIPRLIVAAIAVNVSFYICQIVVDLTNILGYEIQNLLANISNGLGPSVFGDASQFGASEQSSGASILTVIAGAALAAAVVWYVLPFIGSVILMVIVVVLTIIMILMLRKALIVLLIVISPIAFVLYLLPNTERYFNKWLNMFVQLLLVFPTVGLLFGAGQLASTVILVSGGQTKEQYQASKDCNPEDRKAVKDFAQDGGNGYNNICGGGSIEISGTKDGGNSCPKSNLTQNGCMPKVTASWQLGLVATAVAVAPLFAVYSVLKGALNAAGAIGGKITALSGKLTNSSVKRAQQSNADRAKLVGQRYQTAAMQSKRLPGGRAFRRSVTRGLEKEEMESRLNAAKAGVSLMPKNANIAHQNIANQQAINAANSQQAMNYAEARAKDEGPAPADALGQQGADIAQMALASQQAKATAEAIKDIEVNIDGSDITTLERGLANAIAAKDSVAARAYQNSLFRSGSAGLEGYHRAMDSAEGSAGLAAVNDALNANVRANHGSIKDKDPSIMNAATGGGTLSSHYNNGATWSGLSAAQFASLSSGAQKQAAGNISDQAMKDLLKENNAQLLAAVKPGARTELAKRDSGFN